MKKILLLVLFVLLVSGLVYTSRYALKYMHWYAKSSGYPGLYEQEDQYPFLPFNPALIKTEWKLLAQDHKNDGDLPQWPDAKELHFCSSNDTIWLAYSLYNSIDINEPMITIAIENAEGKDWYGAVSFKYREMISTGYVRKGNQYYGYNFLGSEKGRCAFTYNLALNTLYMGISKNDLQSFAGRRFVASVGLRSYWNDDFDQLIEVDQLLNQ